MPSQDDAERKARLIFEEAKAKLSSSILNNETLDKKAFFLAGFYLAIMTALIGLITQTVMNPIAAMLFVSLALAAAILLQAVRTFVFASAGTEAKPLMNDPFALMSCDDLLISMALTYDEKSAHNNVLSRTKARAINHSLLSFLLGLVVSFLSAIYLHLAPKVWEWVAAYSGCSATVP
jgi:uncharacterized membrane protein